MGGMLRTILLPSVMVTSLLFVGGCRSTYYKIWEKLGKEKRDLLVSDVNAVKKSQEETSEHFRDALTRLHDAYGKPNTKLQTYYEKLKSDDERAREQAAALEKRIERMNTTANDLFREWEGEIKEFTDADFKAKSRANLERSQVRFKALSQSLKQSTNRMKPLLARLHETTIFLKHNLNAQSLGGLKGEKKDIERSLEELERQMKASQREADEFLNTIADVETSGLGSSRRSSQRQPALGQCLEADLGKLFVSEDGKVS